MLWEQIEYISQAEKEMQIARQLNILKFLNDEIACVYAIRLMQIC
jgi:hypothetical protein